MNSAYCIVSQAPIRRESKDQSEIVTMILFGEMVEVLEKQEKWWQIACSWDGYKGWIDPKQLVEVEKEGGLEKKHCLSSAHWNIPSNHGNFNLPIGSECFQNEDGSAELGNIKFQVCPCNEESKKSPDDLIAIAKQYLNSPYLWGGRSNHGIDCSGFTQVSFKICGIKLPRDAYQQAEIGTEVSFGEIEPGDLAFFKNSKGRIIHVGIVLKDNKIIHAHGKVRIDQLDLRGILNEEKEAYSHELSFVRRVLNSNL